MRSYQGYTMTKILLALALTLVSLQAENIVHYDKREVKKPEMSKPNHPSTSLYSEKIISI